MRKLSVLFLLASVGAFAQQAPIQTYYQGQAPQYPTQQYYQPAPVQQTVAMQQPVAQEVVPDWFVDIPSNQDTIYSVGDGISGSVSGALGNARANAFEGICQHAGGTVRSQTKVYRQDTESGSTSMSTTAIRNFCADVSVAGTRVERSKVVMENGRYHAFVLVSLDKGTRVAMNRQQQAAVATVQTKSDAQKEFDELDALNKSGKVEAPVFPAPSALNSAPVQVVAPTTTAKADSHVEGIQLIDVDNEEYKRRRDEALQKPGAVIGHTTLDGQ
jgi:hypothetical protein